MRACVSNNNNNNVCFNAELGPAARTCCTATAGALLAVLLPLLVRCADTLLVLVLVLLVGAAGAFEWCLAVEQKSCASASL